MKSALLIYRVDQNDDANLGVINKMNGQADALKNLGFNVDKVVCQGNHVLFNDERIGSTTGLGKHWLKWKFFSFIERRNLDHYDLYLVRYPLSTAAFISWLSSINKKHPESVVLIDMPTYPYDAEWKGPYGTMVLAIDRFYRTRIKRFVSNVLHSGKERSIFGIPVLHMSNGINTTELQLRQPKSHKGIHLLAVGKWQFWHGLDRLLKGIRSYTPKAETISLDIVGVGPEVAKIKELAISLGISKNVTFKGVLKGAELDRLFDKADIGIGTLGIHRKNVPVDCSLKHREYIARGLPFILSGEDPDLEPTPDFCLKVKGDENEIDLKDVVSFSKRASGENITHAMREYAEQKLTWTQKLSVVLANAGIEQ